MSDLVVPDPKKRILSAEEARQQEHQAKYGPGGKRTRPPADTLAAFVTRSEMLEHLPKVALAIGQKMYDQFAEETGQYLREMETALRAEMRRELEARSLRGRARAFRDALRHSRAGDWLIELGILSPAPIPALVDPVDALDPNVQAAGEPAPELPPLEVREYTTFDEATAAFIEQGGVAILRHRRTGDWHLVARDTDTVRRAAVAIGGETANIEDGVTSLVLQDMESLQAARALAASEP